jgi:dipeptidyl aminopeptidase/acylaminoacyl peptidase
MQGGADNRVSLQEGYNMLDALRKEGYSPSYMEFAEGDHCLSNITNYTKIIASWLYN